MTQEERMAFLTDYLRKEREEYRRIATPARLGDRRRLLRSLVNVRPPAPVSQEFLEIQDAYLQERLREKGVTEIEGLKPVQPGLYLWQGDITTLGCDAIVNAANSGMLGCFCPCHGCIDNAIHTFAGVQLRQECARIMARQGHEEVVGQAKITPAYNLPCKYILHTVGPIVQGQLTRREEERLAECYRACLALGEEYRVKSIAFCCLSTGEFHFPRERAAEIAVGTVQEYRRQTNSEMKVIFNVFQDQDYEIYGRILGAG